MEDGRKVCVMQCELPWMNWDCLGVFKGFRKADAAAKDNTESFAKACSEAIGHLPIEAMGYTSDEDGESGEGYGYLTLPWNGHDEIWVYKEPNPETSDGDPEIKGPYQSLGEANDALFPKGARKVFRMAAGTFGPGTYPVERKEGTYTALFAYDDKEGKE